LIICGIPEGWCFKREKGPDEIAKDASHRVNPDEIAKDASHRVNPDEIAKDTSHGVNVLWCRLEILP